MTRSRQGMTQVGETRPVGSEVAVSCGSQRRAGPLSHKTLLKEVYDGDRSGPTPNHKGPSHRPNREVELSKGAATVQDTAYGAVLLASDRARMLTATVVNVTAGAALD